MKTLLYPTLVIVLIAVTALVGQFGEGEMELGNGAAITCTKTGERISGTNKICYYDCAGSAAAMTVQSYQLCPPTIQR